MDWKFKNGAEPQGSSDGFWYDVTLGGAIKLDKLIANKSQLKQAKDAVALLRSLEKALEDAELLIEF